MTEIFLIELGRTLNRIHLYRLGHPLVMESVKESYKEISALLEQEPEIILASSEGKLLINGVVASGPESIQQSLLEFFDQYQLYSILFKRGLTSEEILSFYKLFSDKREYLKSPENITQFLENERVAHIVINTAFFSKVMGQGEDAELDDRAWLENMSLDSMLLTIIRRAWPDVEDQKKIFEKVHRQIQDELAQQVERATSVLQVEKQTLSNEKERIESVVQTTAEGVIIVDNEGNILAMNPVAEKIYGKTLTDLKGKKIGDLSSENIFLSFAKELTNPGDRNISKEVRVESDAYTRETIQRSTAMIENTEGRLVGMMSILTHIAKQRELQETQDQFLHNVTHELRGPLTAIKVSLATLAVNQDENLTTNDKNLLAIAHRNIDRLTRLVNDILDFAKASGDKMLVSVKPIDGKKLLWETLTSFEPWAETKKIKLEFLPTRTLPYVMADADRITQVLVNLFSNAIKFTPQGGKITLKTEASLLSLKVLITDSGPGIPKKDQEKIFQKFFQVKQTEKTNMPGTGLGLFITKKIVEMHHGAIGFTSEEGRGTTFWFTLPVVPESWKQVVKEMHPEKKKSWFFRLFGR